MNFIWTALGFLENAPKCEVLQAWTDEKVGDSRINNWKWYL